MSTCAFEWFAKNCERSCTIGAALQSSYVVLAKYVWIKWRNQILSEFNVKRLKNCRFAPNLTGRCPGAKTLTSGSNDSVEIQSCQISSKTEETFIGPHGKCKEFPSRQQRRWRGRSRPLANQLSGTPDVRLPTVGLTNSVVGSNTFWNISSEKTPENFANRAWTGTVFRQVR